MSVGINCVKCGGLVGPGMCSYIEDTCVQDFALELQGSPETVAPETVAQFQVHCTPSAVVEQCLDAVLADFRPAHRARVLDGGPPVRVLDVCAGYGVWSQVLRRLAAELGFEVHITAVEIREECRPHLERHCDAVVICDAVEFIAHREDRFDLIMGNPNFSFRDPDARRDRNEDGELVEGRSRLRAFEVLVVEGRKLLADEDSRLALFVPKDWTGRSRPLAELAATHKPLAIYDQALPIAFGADGKTDQRVYCMMVWGERLERWGMRATEHRTLPVLDSKQLRWDGDTIPGTEP